MSKPFEYGDRYWCIKTPLSQDGEIYAYADFVEITTHGDLILSHDKDGSIVINLSLAADEWSAVYAASSWTGQRWPWNTGPGKSPERTKTLRR